MISLARNEDCKEMKCHRFNPFKQSLGNSIKGKTAEGGQVRKREEMKSIVDVEGGFDCCGHPDFLGPP